MWDRFVTLELEGVMCGRPLFFAAPRSPSGPFVGTLICALPALLTYQVKVALGSGVTRGLGAGGKPEVGQAAAEESLPEIQNALAGADMVFVTAGEKNRTRGIIVHRSSNVSLLSRCQRRDGP